MHIHVGGMVWTARNDTDDAIIATAAWQWRTLADPGAPMASSATAAGLSQESDRLAMLAQELH